MDDRYIGVFDSGLGGITVLKELKKILPKESFIFLADTKNSPYGDKSLEELELLVRKNIEFLLEKKVKVIVFACNTASILDIAELRKEYKVPIVTVLESTVAAINEEDKKILVAATEAVASSRKHEELIHEKYPEKLVRAQGCRDIVPSIEFKELIPLDIQNIVDGYMGPYVGKGYDTLILGCTHYPIWKDYFSKALSDARIIDPAYMTAVKTTETLDKYSLSADRDGCARKKDIYYVSSDKVIFSEKLEKIFGITGQIINKI